MPPPGLLLLRSSRSRHWLALRPELMAAEHTGDPYLAAEAVVSHTTAAEMWGIGDL